MRARKIMSLMVGSLLWIGLVSTYAQDVNPNLTPPPMKTAKILEEADVVPSMSPGGDAGGFAPVTNGHGSGTGTGTAFMPPITSMLLRGIVRDFAGEEHPDGSIR